MKQRWYNRFTKGNWFTIAGAVIIFLSWVVEKNFQSNWIDEEERLKRSQLVIDIAEAERSSLELLYSSESHKKEKDSAQIAFIQQKLVRVYLNLLSWSKGRISDNAENYENIIQQKRRIDEENRLCLLKHDYTKIDSVFDTILIVFNSTYMTLDNNFSTKVDDVKRKKSEWGNVFTLLYISGSILLAIAYVYEKLFQATEKQILEPQSSNKRNLKDRKSS